jgi:dihydrolipoyl dehydrogenase
MKPVKTEIVIIGAGPGGYTAAFYAADKGKKVILVERENKLGGVCLQRGCIPSKALLHATHLIREAELSSLRGITYGTPRINLQKLKTWEDSVVDRLAQGLSGLAQKRGVEVMYGRGYFEDSKTLRVETSEGQKFIQFDKAIVAVGSMPAMPGAFDLGNKRIMTSTEALELEEIPEELLVVGGGYIGLELGTVYAALGSKVVLVEEMESLLPGVDADLVQPVMRYAKEHFREVRLKTRVAKMATSGKQIKVSFEEGKEEKEESFDRVLVAVGRVPGGQNLGLENTKVKRDHQGFIQVNDQQRTDDPGIYAIGDVAGGELLAHKAFREARIAVDDIGGEPNTSENMIVPAVVFTEPEVAWCGLTQNDAKAQGIEIKVAKFPWAASGRALTLDRPDGLTKLIIEPETERILGVGITGHNAGELISEGVVLIEMGATVRDLAEAIHPHPTLSETLMECAEMFYGTATHALPQRKRGDAPIFSRSGTAKV